MDSDEILRLKQITGLAALFKDIDFGSSWIPTDEEPDSAREPLTLEDLSDADLFDDDYYGEEF